MYGLKKSIDLPQYSQIQGKIKAICGREKSNTVKMIYVKVLGVRRT